MSADVAQVIVAGGGVITAVGAIYLNKRGQKTTDRESQAARALLELEHSLDEKDNLIADYRRRAEDAHSDVTRERERTDAAEARADRDRAVGEQWHRNWRDAEDRCDKYRDQLHTVAQAVIDEAVRAAAVDGVEPSDIPPVPEP